MWNWKADFVAMNRKAGTGLREARERVGMSRRELASRLDITAYRLRQYEKGLIPIEAAHLYYAEILLQAGGFAFYFHPYTRAELFGNPMENVIRFPNLAKLAGLPE